ncbi:MAG: nuclear transport factor 2 family protein [Actinomycetota bacterium]|uniref:SnoaL-like domain-containing protein n=1 Tax=marine metagenome TaxID=408172 RepID=A0A381MZK5_9ZZZZ|nr:nuclear transport factor 2 family protein [Acidimicrobiales bacterium]MEC8922206.1 nuclear transport factor 2 family protein [Actinomycetota bacterium]MEC9316820.1 nuclear transport factor 2 family protein [Actinomycetota bacterium]MED5551595.1 nuclear transport factor 2 family protein [Actinomycetota bacterium]MEE3140754.1 nuclear transport factor 2 family protein [Actinomycetota bacterium]|tara:strand:- start:262 stop:678 length:417 start_codon:yes stop_codon:yes gene_type:complete
MTIDTADRLELHELPGRYGDAIDDRNWDRLRQVFTDDAIFDLTGVGLRQLDGIEDIVHFMDVAAQHPKTHMMTNIYVDDGGESVTMNFRIVALLGKGLVGTASYYDTVVKTPDGWRVKHRDCMLHRRDKRDAPCDNPG